MLFISTEYSIDSFNRVYVKEDTSNIAMINRAHYDYHGKYDDGDHAVDAAELARGGRFAW